ncbi:MAG: hypothetical protein V1907_02950 [Candidatus Kerfeldbacteria bacterium]
MAGIKPTQSVMGRALRFVFSDVVFDVFRFPFWWYTTGTANAARFIWQEFLSILNRLSIPILVRNIGKPMYGDYSKSGRIISFFVRIIVFAFRFVGLAIWTVLLFAGFLVWLALMPFVVYEVVYQFIRFNG